MYLRHYFENICMKNMAKIQLKICAVFFISVYLIGECTFAQENNEILRKKQSNFKVYWNSPTFQCKSHKIYFHEVAQKFGIIQNVNDTFRGDQIVILYDPGDFPALLEQKGTKKLFYRNGGIPQQGNLTLHLEYFKKHVDEQIPDINFNGVGVIDFESWRPVFRQNFGTLLPYKKVSRDLEKQMHPWWPDFLIEKEATRKFETFGRIFMEETLIYMKQLRPNATWGYYAYPYCYNMNSNKQRDCSAETKKENDGISWLFDNSDNYYPSLYMAKNTLTTKQKQLMIEGRIEEAKRIAKENNDLSKEPKIIPYFWYRYRDVLEFLSKEDLYNSIKTLKTMGAHGVILWGSSNDVNTKEKCQNLKNYIENVLGPILLQD